MLPPPDLPAASRTGAKVAEIVAKDGGFELHLADGGV